jgi:hypothetical protein
VREIIPESPFWPSEYTYKSVPPKITSLGEPARSRQIGGGVGRMALPVNISQEREDPILRESARIGLKIALPAAKITGVELQRPEKTLLQQAKGHAVRDALAELYADPGWQGLEKEDQLAEAKSAVLSARKAVADQARQLRENQEPWTLESLNPFAP